MNIKGLYPYENHSLKDMQGEIWKEIPGYEGSYMISNKGRVKSLARFVPTTQGGRYIKNDIILKQNFQKKDDKKSLRLSVSLCSDGIMYTHSVARLVYSAYIKHLAPFKKKKQFILHRDNDIRNNLVENLFLVTASQKMKYYSDLGVITPNFPNFSAQAKKNFLTARYQAVSQYTLEGKYLQTYSHITEAARTVGIHDTAIGQNLRGKSRHAGGFLWKKGNNNQDIPPVLITPINKEIMQFTKEGIYIASYPSIREAERITNVARSGIRACIKGKGDSAGGYLWKRGKDPQAVKVTPLLVPKKSKTISQFDTMGNFLTVYPSMTEASKKVGIPISTLHKALKSESGYAKGFLWLKGNRQAKITPHRRKIRVVHQYDLSGNHIATYSSIVEAARAVGLSSEAIGNTLRGRNKTSGGFVWKYAD